MSDSDTDPSTYTFEGCSNNITFNLGWENATNINYRSRRNKVNNYELILNWDGIQDISGITIKYCIVYNNKTYTTSKTTFTLPIGYGTFQRDENGNVKLNGQGKPIVQEECVRIETRYYFSDGSFSYGEDPIIFCFCPPTDPACSSIKTTKSIGAKKKVGTQKQLYSSAVRNVNGALGFTSNSNGNSGTNGISGSLGFNCRTPAQWNALNLTVGPNNCYKKTDVVILRNSDKALS